MIALQALLTCAPFMNQFFSSAPLTQTQWGYILAVGLASYAVVEVEKWIRLREAVVP